MSNHLIIRPLPFAVAATGLASASQLLSPEPKQVAVAIGGAATIALDLGAATAIDTVFIGYTNDSGAGSFAMSYGPATGFENAVAGATTALPTKLIGGRPHFLKVLAAPVTARFIGLTANLAAGFEIGVVALGKALRPALGPEFGHGKGVIDTGTATRRRDGGFAIDPGTRATSFQWTLGDLTDDVRDQLYAILQDRGETRSVLIVEGTEPSPALSERLHWSLMTRIEAYERRDPELTRWSLKTQDWA